MLNVVKGPLLPLTDGAGCCGGSPLSGHSCAAKLWTGPNAHFVGQSCYSAGNRECMHRFGMQTTSRADRTWNVPEAPKAGYFRSATSHHQPVHLAACFCAQAFGQKNAFRQSPWVFDFWSVGICSGGHDQPLRGFKSGHKKCAGIARREGTSGVGFGYVGHGVVPCNLLAILKTKLCNGSLIRVGRVPYFALWHSLFFPPLSARAIIGCGPI